MTDIESMKPEHSAHPYLLQGLARDAMTGAGVDYTGDFRDDKGNVSAQTPLETCLRLADTVMARNPEGFQALQIALGEV
jgi:hypothetical protein